YTYDEITALLYRALVPYAPVGTPLDIVDEKHLNEAGRWLPLKVGDKQFKAPKLPVSMSQSEDFVVRHQAACLGEHTEAILAEIGYTAAEIAALKADKVVLRSNKMLDIDSASD
ncbi:MAG TPA: CoA transferase, partial [Burkholderiales bacterium]|nr:CoA transferase [Burkholderiales bacterium]